MGDTDRESLERPAIPDLRGDANVSVDVDSLDCYRAIHGFGPVDDQSADPVWAIGVARAKRLLSEFDLAATFFVVGADLDRDLHAARAAQLADDGHELANHTFEHPYDLPEQSGSEIAFQINACDSAVAEITGEQPVGFRAPGYNVDADVVAFSRRAGHRYDASVFPCPSYWLAKSAVMGWRTLRGGESDSATTDPKNLMAPREPYFPDFIDCWRPSASSGGFVEIPVASFGARLLPVIGTSLHLLDRIGFGRVWPRIDASFPRFFNLEMHGIDFLDASDLDGVPDAKKLVARQPDLRVSWEEKKALYRRVFEAVATERRPVTLAEATADIGL